MFCMLFPVYSPSFDTEMGKTHYIYSCHHYTGVTVVTMQHVVWFAILSLRS